MKDALMYGYNDKSLEVALILCTFSGVVLIVHSRVYDLPSYFFLLNNDVRHGFQPVDKAVNAIRKEMITPMTYMSLLHQWACIARLVIIVTHRVHRWTVMIITSLLW